MLSFNLDGVPELPRTRGKKGIGRTRTRDLREVLAHPRRAPLQKVWDAETESGDETHQ